MGWVKTIQCNWCGKIGPIALTSKEIREKAKRWTIVGPANGSTLAWAGCCTDHTMHIKAYGGMSWEEALVFEKEVYDKYYGRVPIAEKIQTAPGRIAWMVIIHNMEDRTSLFARKSLQLMVLPPGETEWAFHMTNQKRKPEMLEHFAEMFREAG